MNKTKGIAVLLHAVLFVFAFGSVSYAYIGPGAGFAVVSSFFILFFTGIIALATVLIWPIRALWLYLKRRQSYGKRKVRRAVIIGLDGMDPGLANRFMKRGLLPNLQRLKESGSFRPLRTTMPSISPVAWSTFSTGVNPGKHRIFDFYTRDPKNYSPVLSSAHIGSTEKNIKIGPVRIPLRRSSVKFLRRSISFWKILGDQGVFSSVLRVPITFPPEKFYGTCLSAMCAPDLRGTQGSFTCFSADNNDEEEYGAEQGTNVSITIQGSRFRGAIPGPTIGSDGSSRSLTIPFEGEVNPSGDEVKLKLDGKRLCLKKGEYSDWVKLTFRAGFRKRVSGIARFLLTEVEPCLKIYMTPINIDPEKPALPVSHPFYFAMSLSKLYGPFATLGLAEDTWALNERVIDETDFLKQAYDIYEDRKTQLFDALRKNKDGFIVTVFDTTDRIQHMFFRYLDDDHPANRDKDTEQHKDTIEHLYRKMDELIGEVLQKIGEDELLMIISDHGFKPFKWGVNLNTWLWQEGYLVLKDGATPGDKWFAQVDWSRTRAFAYGLAGVFINLRGRERHGVVTPGQERLALQVEIKEKLVTLRDERQGSKPIRRCFLAQNVLKGPYVEDAPDLFIGYASGYRASWNSAIGMITDKVIEDNTKSWSGDHSIDPELVPGVFFSNWKLEDTSPALADLAPTILSLFGSAPEGFHDGKALTLTPP